MKIIHAVAAIIPNGDKILAIKRAEELMKGRIDVPAGKIEGGEDHITALIREVKEETNYDIEVDKLFDTVDIALGDVIYRNYLYLAKIVGGEPIPQPEEVEEILWATPQELMDSAIEHHISEAIVHPLIDKFKEMIEFCNKMSS